MNKILLFLTLLIPIFSPATLTVGIAKTDITPVIGTPSAGYTERKGEGMQGVHDPLLAIALFIDNGEKKIVLCSVDSMGFTYEMSQQIIQLVHAYPSLSDCEIFIGSSHTHSGGGAFLNIPVVGESLAGAYSPAITRFYVERTADAIIQASQNAKPAKVGIGYGNAENLSEYRGKWPKNITPLSDVTIIKVTKQDDTPIAVLFNYPVHPTVLNSQNKQFSADFVGYARDQLFSHLNVQALYFNGAQGDIIPVIVNKQDLFESCDLTGRSLAETVESIWEKTEAKDSLDIKTSKINYIFKPEATPFGLVLPMECYKTEMNLIVFNKVHAFITIPGELSTLYDRRLKESGLNLSYTHVSILGLTNDAHGYIILPESWNHKTFESGYSFGGEKYGEITLNRAESLLKNNSLKE